jgi:hypothetical protein
VSSCIKVDILPSVLRIQDVYPGSATANSSRCPVLRIRITLMRPWMDPDPDFYLMWIRMSIRILSLFDADANPDPTFHPNVDPAPNPSFQITAQTFEKVLK